MSLFQRLEKDVMTQKQRTKNRIREHAHHGWTELRTFERIVLMNCPCGWVGWIPKEGYNNGIHC